MKILLAVTLITLGIVAVVTLGGLALCYAITYIEEVMKR